MRRKERKRGGEARREAHSDGLAIAERDGRPLLGLGIVDMCIAEVLQTVEATDDIHLYLKRKRR